MAVRSNLLNIFITSCPAFSANLPIVFFRMVKPSSLYSQIYLITYPKCINRQARILLPSHCFPWFHRTCFGCHVLFMSSLLWIKWLNEIMKPLSGKRRKHPKNVTAWTSLLDDECFIPLLKQLTMNDVRLNAKKYSKAIVPQRWMNQNLHSTLPLIKHNSKIQATIFGTRSLP